MAQISYELANELKNAGFPMQKLSDWNMVQCPFNWGHFNYNGTPYILPALSELIESCGDKFSVLNKGNSRTQHWGGRWHASSQEDDLVDSIHVFGTTPEEAVARLWLAINSKEDL
jgi:hypothetical protein